ncbi:Maf family protein [Flindersiella endophytica]
MEEHPTPRFVLGSASPARLATLRAAGIEPDVLVSGVDEDDVEAGTPAGFALELARRKAGAVAEKLNGDRALVLGCDSVLELGGEILGKPGTAETAKRRWQAMRGRHGTLHTGHCLIDLAQGGRTAEATASTVVHFADVTDAEIDAYVATGEPLVVAGAFTVDGLGGPFVERIEGDHHNVVGLSLPLLRRLLADLGVFWPDLWNR